MYIYIYIYIYVYIHQAGGAPPRVLAAAHVPEGRLVDRHDLAQESQELTTNDYVHFPFHSIPYQSPYQPDGGVGVGLLNYVYVNVNQ